MMKRMQIEKIILREVESDYAPHGKKLKKLLILGMVGDDIIECETLTQWEIDDVG